MRYLTNIWMGGTKRALETMKDISDSISQENNSVKTQTPQLEEYLSELLRLRMVLYNGNTRRYYFCEKNEESLKKCQASFCRNSMTI